MKYEILQIRFYENFTHFNLCIITKLGYQTISVSYFYEYSWRSVTYVETFLIASLLYIHVKCNRYSTWIFYIFLHSIFALLNLQISYKFVRS